MPEETVPVASPDPTPVAAPSPDAGMPAPGGDPSVLSTPGPTRADAVQTQVAPYQQAEQGAYRKASDIANESTAPPPPGPHARLLAMVRGLSIGLGAAAESIGTGGREGGAKEVVRIRGEEQAQQQAAQAAREAQKNTKIQQQLMVADTNHKMAQNILLMATLPNELAMSDLQVSGAKQTQAVTGADFAAAHGGMTPDEFNSMLSGSSPAASMTGKGSFFVTNAQQQVDAAGKILGSNDPYVQKVQTLLGDGKTSPKDLYTATTQLQNQIGLQEKATDAQTKKEAAAANSAVGKLSTPEALAAPGAQAAIQAKIDDPNTDPKDILRLRALIPQAAVAQLNAENIKQREARNQQIINQGDSDTAGKLLANRSLTLGELKSRQVTPKFIADAVLAAQKYDPAYKAAEADAQAKIAGSEANVQFFGNTDSLLVKGGTLDQLSAAYKALGNTQIPVINKLDNLQKAARGSGPLAAAYAAQLGVADDYSKVISGGSGSDTSRQQALDIINVNLSPEGRDAAIPQIRNTITSQRNGRVGTNPYLRDMFPDPSTRQETAGQAGTQAAAKRQPPAGLPPGSLLMQVPGGQPHWMSPDKIEAARKANAVEVQ